MGWEELGKTQVKIDPSKIASSADDWEQGHVGFVSSKTYEENKVESDNRIRTKATYRVFGNVEVNFFPGYKVAIKVFNAETGLFEENITWMTEKTVLNFPSVVEIGIQIAKAGDSVITVDDFSKSGVEIILLYTLADVFKKLHDNAIYNNITLQHTPTYAEMLLGGTATKPIAHRGQMGVAPENSMPAYEAAVEAGYWAIECDPKRTSDGVWVMMHDISVDRTTDGTGNVSSLTYEQIQGFNIDEGANVESYPNLKVPTLYDTMALCKKNNIIPLLHIDTALHIDEVVDMIKSFGMETRVIWQTYYKSVANTIRKLSSKIPIMMISTYAMDEVDKHI